MVNRIEEIERWIGSAMMADYLPPAVQRDARFLLTIAHAAQAVIDSEDASNPQGTPIIVDLAAWHALERALEAAP
jgi:hypothetical protein